MVKRKAFLVNIVAAAVKGIECSAAKNLVNIILSQVNGTA